MFMSKDEFKDVDINFTFVDDVKEVEDDAIDDANQKLKRQRIRHLIKTLKKVKRTTEIKVLLYFEVNRGWSKSTTKSYLKTLAKLGYIKVGDRDDNDDREIQWVSNHKPTL